VAGIASLRQARAAPHSMIVVDRAAEGGRQTLRAHVTLPAVDEGRLVRRAPVRLEQLRVGAGAARASAPLLVGDTDPERLGEHDEQRSRSTVARWSL
jgi:hypothetical protein